MIITTTNTLQDKQITAYHGVVTGTCIMGANVFHEEVIEKAKNEAIAEMIERAERMHANAIIGIDIDYETIGGSMLMVAVSGTAVTASEI